MELCLMTQHTITYFPQHVMLSVQLVKALQWMQLDELKLLRLETAQTYSRFGALRTALSPARDRHTSSGGKETVIRKCAVTQIEQRHLLAISHDPSIIQ